MSRLTLLLAVAATLAACVFAAEAMGQAEVRVAVTTATSPAPHWLTARYSSARKKVCRRFGCSRAGRDIATQGVKHGHTVRPPEYKEMKVSYLRLKAWLHPAILSRMVMRSGDPHPAPGYIGKPVIVSAGMPACTWVPESGGNYSAHNPSGAGGKYQMMPGLWHAFGGTGNAWQAPPAEQELVARRVYDAEGTQPWSRAAGGNC